MRSLAESLRRSPVLWFWLTVLVMFTAASGMAPVVRDQDQSRTWLGIVAAAVMAYAVVAVWVIVPRLKLDDAVRPAVAWAFALSPFCAGLGAVVAGGGRSVPGIGFVVSVVLLWRTTRQLRKP